MDGSKKGPPGSPRPGPKQTPTDGSKQAPGAVKKTQSTASKPGAPGASKPGAPGASKQTPGASKPGAPGASKRTPGASKPGAPGASKQAPSSPRDPDPKQTPGASKQAPSSPRAPGPKQAPGSKQAPGPRRPAPGSTKDSTREKDYGILDTKDQRGASDRSKRKKAKPKDDFGCSTDVTPYQDSEKDRHEPKQHPDKKLADLDGMGKVQYIIQWIISTVRTKINDTRDSLQYNLQQLREQDYKELPVKILRFGKRKIIATLNACKKTAIRLSKLRPADLSRIPYQIKTGCRGAYVEASRQIRMLRNAQYQMPDPRQPVERHILLLAFPSRLTADTMYLMYGNREVESSIRSAIIRNWPLGLRYERSAGDNIKAFKLNGKPFGDDYFTPILEYLVPSSQEIAKTRLMRGIVEALLENGWCLKNAINFNRHSKSDSFVFQQSYNSMLEFDPVILVLSLQSADRLQVVGASSNLLYSIKQALVDYWPPGIDDEEWDEKSHESRFVLKGFPWRSRAIHRNLVNSRMVILQLVRVIHDAGYLLLASGHPNQVVSDVDTLYFVKKKKDSEPFGECFLLGVHQDNYVFTVDAQEACDNLLRTCVEECWSQGYDYEKRVCNMTVFQLAGLPWNTEDDEEAIQARKLMIHIFQEFQSNGWRVYGTIDLNKNLDDTSSFIMVRCEPKSTPIMALKLSNIEYFCMINTPPKIQTVIEETLTEYFRGQISVQSKNDDVKEIHFQRYLLYTQGIFCIIFEKLEELGWYMLSSADLSIKFFADASTHFPMDLHTIFFEYAERSEAPAPNVQTIQPQVANMQYMERGSFQYQPSDRGSYNYQPSDRGSYNYQPQMQYAGGY